MKIETEIRNTINEIICGKYVGKLKVTTEEMPGGTLWMLLLYLDMEQTPMVLAYQGTEEQFKEFVKSEIKARKLHAVKFWSAVQEYPEYGINE